MSAPISVLGVSGSLRVGSLNTGLLRAIKNVCPPDVNFEITTLSEIPLYNGDVEEAKGLPSSVVELRERIVKANALIFASPEYNSGISGVLKNALDWVSRNSASYPNVLAGKPVALVGATPGGFGTLSAQAHTLPVLRALGMLHWSQGRLMVSKAHQAFHENQISDEALISQIRIFITEYSEFVKKLERSHLV